MADIIHRTQRDTNGLLLRKYSVNTPMVNQTDWLVNPDFTAVAGVQEKYWKVDGDSVVEMNQTEKDANDAAILDSVKAAKRDFLIAKATEYLNERYSDFDRDFFKTLMIEAQLSGKTNRRIYLTPWFTWMEAAVTEVKNKVVAVNAATTVAEVVAVALDTAPLNASDPGVTIGNTLAIPD